MIEHACQQIVPGDVNGTQQVRDHPAKGAVRFEQAEYDRPTGDICSEHGNQRSVAKPAFSGLNVYFRLFLKIRATRPVKS